jgi:thiamine pyrophosphokinase
MRDKKKKVILFANGEFPFPERIISQISDEDILIAVDGGLNYITQFGLVPNLIIGDLDSADPEKVDAFRNQGVEVRKFPAEKDETDLELALKASQEYQTDQIWIAGALGNRIDQSLANIFLIASPEFKALNLRLIDGQQEIFVIRHSKTINGEKGDRVSLLPLNGPVSGVTTQGLYYPLENETLTPHQTRGISNQMTRSESKVTIKDGLLLCIHEASNINERGEE